MSIRRIIRRSVLLYAASAIALCIYCIFPWLRGVGLKFGPLTTYRVFEVGKQFDGIPERSISGWREPTSRWELLTTRFNDIIFDHKTIERGARQYKQKPQIQRGPDPIPTAAGDTLDDFVIDFGDSFGYPESYEQLEHAIVTGMAERSSSFFSSRWGRQKPFYGRIPTSLCYQDSGSDHGSFRINPFQYFKDFKVVNANLASPPSSQVWIVAASGFDNARRAAYEHKPPVMFDGDECWAVVFAMYTKNAPLASVIDRIAIGKAATDVFLYRPINVYVGELKAYWFFVPLGRLTPGPYSVNVHITNDGSTLATTTAELRTATKEEVAVQKAADSKYQVDAAKHYDEVTVNQRDHGAALQLRLQRLASFVGSNSPETKERVILSEDVAKLGATVDWYLNPYGVSNPDHYRLEPPDPDFKLESIVPRSEFDNTRATWKPSQIKLSDIWMCDGTDAGWFASSTYRNIPELNGALTAKDPAAIQLKIRKIWKALEEKSKVPRTQLASITAKGTIDDAIEAAYQAFVEDRPPSRSFSPDDEVWAVFVAKRSFIIRDVYSRTYGDNFDKTGRTEYLVRASAYIARADGVADHDRAPVTFALIPLGKNRPNSVGVMPTFMSICCRDLKQGTPSLLDAKAPEAMKNDFWGDLSQSTGFTVSK